jgi:hypothetical protein
MDVDVLGARDIADPQSHPLAKRVVVMTATISFSEIESVDYLGDRRTGGRK